MQTSQWCQVQGAEVIGGTFEVIDFCVRVRVSLPLTSP